MRQALGAFKTGGRMMIRMTLLALVMMTASSCATITGKDKMRQAEAQAEALQAASTRNAALKTEVEKLKADNARLETKVADLQRRVAKAAANEVEASAAAAEAEKQAASFKQQKVAERTPSTAPAAPVVAAPNADVALPGAPVPVDESPRLVQPTFSSAEQIFENEAASPEIKMTSVLWGVHLASYRHMAEASAGWKKLQREYPDELGLLEPRIEKVTIKGKGQYLRLVGGGFSSREKAKALCDTLATKGLFCRVVNFGGERLSMLEAARLR